MIAADALTGGFADPVFDSQSVFRSVLAALSRPGRSVECVASVTPPPPLAPTAAAIVATLADALSPVWLDATLSDDAVSAWIAFHAGAPLAADPREASFAVVGNAAALPDLAIFAQGTAEYPDRSATIIVQLDSLEAGPGLVLRGPGIRDSALVSPQPLPADFVARMQANRALFPRGVDLILVAGRHILGLPRTTRVEAA